MDVKEIIDLVKNPGKDDIDLIGRAFEFAERAHEGQKRYSGEPFFVHPFETAKTLSRLGLDSQTISAGLLHDVCEGDTANLADEKILKKEFGNEIAFLVSGVTKLGKLKYRGEKEKVENLRKMFLAMAKDIRVVLIKLADRLHNMRTLEHVPKEKQKRIALETLEIYAPLANRLGMGEIRDQLEDLAFPFVYPEECKKTKELLKNKYEQKEGYIAKIKYKLSEELKKNGLENIKIDSRVKHLYSLFKKLRKPGVNMDIDLVYDLIALRIIADTVEDCYRILGIIHNLWKPLTGRIKDYIAVPKSNGYQSLHTTVFADGGKITEIQIRTRDMHEEAERGIAAHWAYEESDKPKTGGKIHPRLAWVNQLIEWQGGVSKSKDFLKMLKIDFFKDRVFCFTPKGDVIDLPEGATAIDFAYAIHAEIGNQAIGAIINNKFVSLNSVLQNGDIVEIKTQKNKKPSLEWLKHAKTSLTRKQIRSALKKRI
ncbi:MAG: RelA/SpoT family protein [Candidatus Parcubacteria bacterium]|nr:RelA/SpoT family protein [Candidatus Parcubacteria bacterium]